MRKECGDAACSQNLQSFSGYDEFVAYVQSLIALEPEQYEALYQVMLKLEQAGRDPVSVLKECHERMEPQDCLDMLNFMMFIDSLSLEQIREMI